jgi:hypothetical protein
MKTEKITKASKTSVKKITSKTPETTPVKEEISADDVSVKINNEGIGLFSFCKTVNDCINSINDNIILATKEFDGLMSNADKILLEIILKQNNINCQIMYSNHQQVFVLGWTPKKVDVYINSYKVQDFELVGNSLIFPSILPENTQILVTEKQDLSFYEIYIGLGGEIDITIPNNKKIINENNFFVYNNGKHLEKDIHYKITTPIQITFVNPINTGDIISFRSI